MHLLYSSWCRSLVALALLGWLNSPTAMPADEPPGEGPHGSVAAANLPSPEGPQRQEVEQWAHAGQDGGREGLSHERQKLEKEANRIEGELREIPEHEGDRREQLHRELGSIRERLDEICRQGGDRRQDGGTPPLWAELRDRVAELFNKRRMLEEQGERFRREIDEMRDGPDSERTQDVRRKLEEVKREAEEVARKSMEIIEHQKREIQEQIERLRQSGQHDAAERIMQQATRWMEETKRMAGGREEPGEKGTPDDLERRIQHVKVAIENLHAAGFHEPAERLRSDVDRMIREHRERAERGHDRPHGDGPQQGPPRHDGPQPDLNAVLEQMRNEQQQMRSEMQELRELLKNLIGRERQERPDRDR